MIRRRVYRRRAPSSILAAFLALAFLLASCSDDDDPDAATTTSEQSTTTSSSTTTTSSTSTTTTTSAPPDDEAAIVERYLEFWEVRFEANSDPVNPDDPRFAAVATGPQLDNVITETRQRLDAGLALRRPENSVTERRPRVVEISGDVATIQDCSVNDSIVYRVATDEVVDDSVVTRSTTATMRLIDGQWRLESTREIQKWEGVAGCALADES